MENINLNNGLLSVSINPVGAELTSLKDSYTEYIWEGNPAFWGKHSPVLFPIVGALKNDTYFYEGKHYSLGRHGFARDKVFTVKAQTANSVTFSLTADEETKQAYPFDFELQLTYTLNEKTLNIHYDVINSGNVNLPFSIGAHPAFALPGDFESYGLVFDNDEPLVSKQLENNLLTHTTVNVHTEGGLLPLNYKLFENDALVFTSLTSKGVTLTQDDKAILKVKFSDFPDLGIWTKVGAPFVCIEPWQGYADSIDSKGIFTEKPGIINLGDGKNFTAAISIEIMNKM